MARFDFICETARSLSLSPPPALTCLVFLTANRVRHCDVAIPRGSRRPVSPVIVMDDNEMAAPCNRHLLTLRA
jgi:hypothetical protein